MSSAADRKRKQRELRRLGFRGEVSFPIHENGIGQLVAFGELTESEADDPELVREAIAALINDGGLERLARRLETVPAPENQAPEQPRGSEKVRRKTEDFVFTY